MFTLSTDSEQSIVHTGHPFTSTFFPVPPEHGCRGNYWCRWHFRRYVAQILRFHEQGIPGMYNWNDSCDFGTMGGHAYSFAALVPAAQ